MTTDKTDKTPLSAVLEAAGDTELAAAFRQMERNAAGIFLDSDVCVTCGVKRSEHGQRCGEAKEALVFPNTGNADAHLAELRAQRLNTQHWHLRPGDNTMYDYRGTKADCPYCRDSEGGC